MVDELNFSWAKKTSSTSTQMIIKEKDRYRQVLGFSKEPVNSGGPSQTRTPRNTDGTLVQIRTEILEKSA